MHAAEPSVARSSTGENDVTIHVLVPYFYALTLLTVVSCNHFNPVKFYYAKSKKAIK